MPIYEYRCEDCGATFDKLVRSMTVAVEVECPKCQSKNCKKAISLFGATSSTSSSASAGASCATGG